MRYNVREVKSIFDFCSYAMHINVETARDEDSPRGTLYVLGGEAISRYIAGVTVYEFNLPYTVIHFIWELDGLVYRFTPSRLFTPEQTMDVIRSMIE